jgi:hypothetical protein
MSSRLSNNDYANVFVGTESNAMTEAKKFSVPHEIEDILDQLPSQVTLHVPDHVLSIWFPPGPVDGVLDGPALTRAQSYAQSCGCKFGYHRSIREGIFYKPIPPGD